MKLVRNQTSFYEYSSLSLRIFLKYYDVSSLIIYQQNEYAAKIYEFDLKKTKVSDEFLDKSVKSFEIDYINKFAKVEIE